MPWEFLATALTVLISILVWVGNKWWERRAADAERREKITDLMRALRAEIRAYSDTLSEEDLDAHLAYMAERIAGGGDGEAKFVPIVPRETRDTVYAALLPELQLLPTSVIEPVVLYYTTVQAVSNLADDMRGERFAAVSAARMGDMYMSFIEMKRTAKRMSEDAYTALSAEITQMAATMPARSRQ
ncbi:MAG: hypothetical protein AAF713_02260 [Pseudomonadota bacterium]